MINSRIYDLLRNYQRVEAEDFYQYSQSTPSSIRYIPMGSDCASSVSLKYGNAIEIQSKKEESIEPASQEELMRILESN